MTNYRCLSCKHYLGFGACHAFIKGIPEGVMKGKDDHSKPLPDQKNDIVFEPIEK